MTHTKKILVSLLALAAFGNALSAQDAAPRHQLSATVQGIGIGSMPFGGSASWNDNPGLSLGFSAGYTYWFNNRIGFRTGLRFSRLSYSQSIDNLDMPFSATLPLSSLGLPGGTGSSTVSLHSSASSLREKSHYAFLELPLQAALRFDRFFLNLGVSLAKAVSAGSEYSYDNPACEITALPDLGITMASPVPMSLNGEQNGKVKNADMVKPFFFLLDAEAGYNFPLSDVTSLGVGVFGRFAPIAHKTKNSNDAFAIQEDATFQVIQPAAASLVEKMGYYEVGLSIGLNFGWNCKKKNAADDPALVSATNEYNERMSSELEAMKTARENAENELAAMKTTRQKLEKELAAAQKANAQREAAEKEAVQKAAEQKANASQNANEKSRPQGSLKPEAEILVNFDYNKTKPIDDEATDAKLLALCAAMQADNSLQAVVTGHTDNIGSKRGNQNIGHKRAAAVKRKMIKMGAPAQNIQCVSKGQSEPVADNSTEEGRAQNRRVIVRVK